MRLVVPLEVVVVLVPEGVPDLLLLLDPDLDQGQEGILRPEHTVRQEVRHHEVPQPRLVENHDEVALLVGHLYQQPQEISCESFHQEERKCYLLPVEA